MAGLDVFNDLPMKQKVGVIAGIGVIIAGGLYYMLSTALDELGPDEDNLLSFMLHTEAPASIWGDIKSLRSAAAVDKVKAAKLPVREKVLKGLLDDILKSQERLPTETEKGKITEEISQFIRDVNLRESCELHISSIKILKSQRDR